MNNGILNFHGYILISKPEHKFADRDGYVRKHRIIYEDHHKCCLLPWVVIHHKNGIRNDNRIENLEPLDRSTHAKLHLKKDMNERFCFICKGKTQIVNGYESWYYKNKNLVCRKCFQVFYRIRIR